MAKKPGKKKAAKKASKRKTSKQAFEETKRARLARDHAKAAVKNFYEAFDKVRKARKASGPPTDGEQDLARAAVVFAAGGLDITVKALIRGSLRTLAECDDDVKGKFEEFTRDQLKSAPDTANRKNDSAKFLAQLLVSQSPYEKLIENYIFELTGSSLQSVDELFKSAAALDLDDKFLKQNKAELVLAFRTRNDIIHELDVNFEGGHGQRKRKSRTKRELQRHSTLLLQATDYFIRGVEEKLKACK